MNIDFDYYKTFYFIAKNKNITRAAEELNISQPAISRMLKTLEYQLGVKLFIREKRGVILTKEGKELYDQISSNIENLINIDYDLKKIFSNKTIKICIDSNILNHYFITKLKNNIDYLKNISFLNIGNFAELNNKLVNNIIDCAIISKNDNYQFNEDLIFQELTELHICLITKNLINSKDLFLENTFILQDKNYGYGKYINKYLEDNNITIKNPIYVDNYENIKPFIEHNIAIGFVIEEFVKNDLENNKLFKIELDKKINPIKIGILYNKNNKVKVDNITQKLMSKF